MRHFINTAPDVATDRLFANLKRCNLPKLWILYLALFLLPFAGGCADRLQPQGNPIPATNPPLPIPSVTISPQSETIKRGTSSNFTAAVANGADSTVSWSIKEGSAGGSITDSGVYTAPAIDGIYHVVATSRSDSTRSATASVTVAAFVFTSTGNMAAPRFNHTATLLSNGQVFVAGGAMDAFNKSPLVDRAELFNPATGTFQSAGKVVREFHSATLLANGDVLFAGGITGWPSPDFPEAVASAEILKAGSGALQPTGSMSGPRYGHTATLLKDGRVLIAGGVLLSETKLLPTKTAELYDPVSGTFAPAGNMAWTQTSATATLLLNGKVLIAGFGSAELFDPATNSFTTTVNAPVMRFACTATLLPDGRVLIAGGETYYDFFYTGPNELYDPVTGQFTFTGTMATQRWGHTATLLSDGTILLTGGFVDANNVATTATEIYDPATGSFKPSLPMLKARFAHTETRLLDGSVLLTGGAASDPGAEIYH